MFEIIGIITATVVLGLAAYCCFGMVFMVFIAPVDLGRIFYQVVFLLAGIGCCVIWWNVIGSNLSITTN